MQYIVKHFSELTIEELLEIYKLRVSVFVVEQKCPIRKWTTLTGIPITSGFKMKTAYRHMHG